MMLRKDGKVKDLIDGIGWLVPKTLLCNCRDVVILM
jgi:hypothetical protein